MDTITQAQGAPGATTAEATMLPTATPFAGDWWTKGPRNLGLAERAIRESWYPITPDLRAEMVAAAAEVVRHAKSNRTRLAAIKVLAVLDQLNAKREAGPKTSNHLHIHGPNPDAGRSELDSILAALRDRRGAGEDPGPAALPAPGGAEDGG